MQLIDFNDIALPVRMANHDVQRISSVSRIDIVGGAGYALSAKFGVQKYGATGFYHSQIAGWLRDEVINQLLSSMGTLGILRARTAKGEIRRCYAYLTRVNPINDTEGFGANLQRVELEFEADPYWYSDSLILIEPVASTKVLAVNQGNANSQFVKFTLSPTANISSLTLTNASGATITYSAALITTDVLIIDAMTGTVTKNGTNVYQNVTFPNTQISLFELLRNSDNEITISAAVTGEIEYREAWV